MHDKIKRLSLKNEYITVKEQKENFFSISSPIRVVNVRLKLTASTNMCV